MAIRIIVLNDGETWAGEGSILEITEEAYERLECGESEVKHLTDNDILSERLIEMGD